MAIPANTFGTAKFSSLLLDELNAQYDNFLEDTFTDAHISEVEFVQVLGISESDSEIIVKVDVQFTCGRQWNSCADSYAEKHKNEIAQVKIWFDRSVVDFEFDDFEIELTSGGSPPDGDYY